MPPNSASPVPAWSAHRPGRAPTSCMAPPSNSCVTITSRRATRLPSRGQFRTPAAAALDQPNFAASGGVRFNDDAFNVRADHFTTDKLHLFGRYSLQDFRMVAPGAFGLVAGGPGLDASGSTSAYAGASESRNHSVA